jgi:thiamine-phosphate pyrophosphorylase
MQQTVIARILDANLDRSREGLRVIEEWCRFGLNDRAMTDQCKHLRQQLGALHTDDLRAARDTPGDPGTALTHPQEAQRADLQQVLQANFCRVQEALRVLEEYGKLRSPDFAATAKAIRYQVYTLESRLGNSFTINQRLQGLQKAQLYLVTSPEPNLVGIVEAALQGGLSLVQYRDKTADNGTRLERASQLKALCDRYGALFIVNDHIDIALAVDADGVHLGQQDFPYAVARHILGPDKLIGRSTTSPTELQDALAENPDYIGVGPVYETPTKAGKAAAGHEYVRHAADRATLPWFAIGGVDSDNLPSVIAAGAHRVSVVRAIMQAADPTAATRSLLAQLSAAPLPNPSERTA